MVPIFKMVVRMALFEKMTFASRLEEGGGVNLFLSGERTFQTKEKASAKT